MITWQEFGTALAMFTIVMAITFLLIVSVHEEILKTRVKFEILKREEIKKKNLHDL